MATTVFRRDPLTRKLVNPASASVDYLGRVTTSTVDFLGRSLISKVFAGTTAYSLGEYIELAAGTPVFKVTVAGTTAAGAPTPPGPGLTVVSGTATLTQVHPQGWSNIGVVLGGVPDQSPNVSSDTPVEDVLPT